MTAFIWIRWILAGAVGMVMLAPSLRAEVPFTVTVDKPERTLDTSGFTTYEMHLTNTTGDTIQVYASRTVVDVPDTTWHNSVCSMSTCYPEEVSILPPEFVEPNAMSGFTLHVISGRTYGQTGRITIHLDTGPGTEGIDLQFVVRTEAPVAPIYRVSTDELTEAASPEAPVDFSTDVYNMTSDTLSVQMIRVEEYFPDETWSSVLCVEDSCYASDVTASRSRARR